MAKPPFRILQVLTAMNRGGAETMVMNHYRALNRDKVQFDFLVHRIEKGDYDDEIEALGGRIFRAFPIRPWSYYKYFCWLDKFFKEHEGEFLAVHGHIQENSGFALKYARKHGISNLVASSHIAELGLDLKYPFRKFGKIWTKKYATIRLACGTKAGEFLYENLNFKLFNNAIDANRYRFFPATRKLMRKQFDIADDNFVIGSVARFSPQKNHAFIIKCFVETLKLIPSARLMLVGTGVLMEDVKELTKRLEVFDKVIFTGLRADVPDLLQAFDVFLMPSVFEGLPVSVIEAQAAGLPCVLSDVIDSETDITGNLTFESLSSPLSLWAKDIADCQHIVRKDSFDAIEKNGYDIHSNITKLLSFYGLKNM